ncbi:MAG: hypothetical protein WCB68_10130 [Pyrinomonadaceae bacterium]
MDKENDERGMMNDELKTVAFNSSFIVYSALVRLEMQTALGMARLWAYA